MLIILLCTAALMYILFKQLSSHTTHLVSVCINIFQLKNSMIQDLMFLEMSEVKESPPKAIPVT